MNFRDSAPGRIITLLDQLTGPPVGGRPDLAAVLASEEKLAVYLPDLRADRESLLTNNLPSVPVPVASNSGEKKTLDGRAEAAVKLVRVVVQAGQLLAQAEGRDADRQALAALEAQLFESGLRFLNLSPDVQIGETDRLVRRLASADALGGLALAGRSFADLVALVAANNDAFRQAVAAPVAAPTPSEPSLFAARVAAAGTLNALESAIYNVRRRTDDPERRARLDLVLDALQAAAFVEAPAKPAPEPTPPSPSPAPVGA